MKIRRALATAAATAVIAPAALLAAPAAYADDTPAPVPTGEAPADPGTDDQVTPDDGNGGETAPGEGSGDDGGTDGADAPATGDGGQDTDGTDGAGDETPASGSKPGEKGEDPADPADPAGPADGEPADECAVDAADLRVTVSDLPSQLVAGGAWSSFSVHLKNTTDETLDEVFPILYAVPMENIDRPDEVLEIQYQDPGTGEWTSFNEWTNGAYFGYFTLEAQQTAELSLRIRADKDAEKGDGFALVAGDYYKADGSCGWSEEAWYDFTILAAGSKPGEVPPAKPGKPGTGDQGGKPDERPGRTKPQGGLEELPVKGNLAQTGSSSMLPAIAVIGGVAMVAGAGAIFVVRRRRAGDAGTATA
ncbi:LPXTG cell wall anchor domain-containing protein [Streptomyces sp. Ru87]|uniref:LPXTG cell wall anchor domain-containing protein n=1 Tax=Streptomyces sp. Ru87 TaxID=2044307 RepID=UPI000BF41CD7|nr:LPXTG cell wall anchor domain-containing protein [Streptomyces sp. Ru87]PGH48629.1 cell wall protein [Streptomyces sp. Ru87]